MKVFLTGGTGFIGGAVARQLRDLGHDVVALVRSPQKADDLRRIGATLIEGDLSDPAAITAAAKGCDVAIHGAAIYRVGVTSSEAKQLREANVDGTRHALAGILDAGVQRVVYVSTVGVFGNTKGQVVDETYERREADGFLSVYDETKYEAHQIAKAHIADGAPIVIVQPSAVYGPRDHSELGDTLMRASQGKLPAVPFGDLGVSMVHVDDVASGIILALDKGKIGESYVLAGEQSTMAELVKKAARLGGKSAPRVAVPTTLLRVVAPAGRLLGPVFGMPTNIGELVRASGGVTYYASHDKATRELDYRPRALDAGLASAVLAN
ncbi:MAG: NAD-dependent epimerase/dehydratase family protein [Solirubrobacteraceae bacterium]|nr:NAD-dependent epimerase/dehydratase family protein [Solirubrobacteraceae bacterium]